MEGVPYFWHHEQECASEVAASERPLKDRGILQITTGIPHPIECGELWDFDNRWWAQQQNVCHVGWVPLCWKVSQNVKRLQAKHPSVMKEALLACMLFACTKVMPLWLF